MVERISMVIDGMSCGHCVRAVDQALSGVRGVRVENVGVGSASVVYDPEAVTPEQIQAAVSDEGYRVRSIGRTP